MDTKADWLFVEDRHFLASPRTDLKQKNKHQILEEEKKIRTWK